MNSTISSLRELDRVEDRIRQHRQVFTGPIVILEGPTDELVLKPHFTGAALFPADGRNNVIRAAAKLQDWGATLVAGIVDADFEAAEPPPLPETVTRYDQRDLEAMLIELGVLGAMLDHIGSSPKVEAAGGSVAVVSELIRVAAAITALRVMNAREGWGLNFDEVDLASKIDPHTLEFKAVGYCMALHAASETIVSIETLKGIADAADVDDGLGPRGKDVVAIAGVALRRRVGGLPAQAAGVELLTNQLHHGAGLALSLSPWLQRIRASLGLAV